MKRWQALLALLLVVIVWGSTFLIVRNTTKELSTFPLLFYRFLIGALAMLPFALPSLRKTSRSELRVGFGLGALLFVSFAAQTEGLSMTSASRGGFITGLNVVLVPVLGALFFSDKISRASWLGVGMAFGGLFLLVQCGASGEAAWLGDALVMLCALTFAGHIIAVDRTTKSFSVVGLTVVQLGTVAVLALICSIVSGDVPTIPSGPGILSLFYLGTVASAMILALQLPAQRVVSATETALIFSLEPVFAALFAVVFGGESLCLGFGLGGALMLCGILTCEVGSPKNASA
jgi:drug/metabolite transporter (DMT)-like permease